MKRAMAKAAVLGAVAIGAVGAGAVLAVRRCLVLVTVEGPSMEPTYRDGDLLLVRRVGPDRLTVGDVVVFTPERPREPEVPAWWAADDGGGIGAAADPPRTDTEPQNAPTSRLWLVKRVAALPGDPVPRGVPNGAGGPVPPGRLAVLGDDAERSVDSRHDSLLPAHRVRGRVLRRVAGGPPASSGVRGNTHLSLVRATAMAADPRS